MRQIIDAVTALRRMKPNMGTWNIKECGTYIEYKKVDTHTAMPSKVADRRRRCLEVMYRQSSSCSPHASDDEDEEVLDKNILPWGKC